MPSFPPDFDSGLMRAAVFTSQEGRKPCCPICHVKKKWSHVWIPPGWQVAGTRRPRGPRPEFGAATQWALVEIHAGLRREQTGPLRAGLPGWRSRAEAPSPVGGQPQADRH